MRSLTDNESSLDPIQTWHFLSFICLYPQHDCGMRMSFWRASLWNFRVVDVDSSCNWTTHAAHSHGLQSWTASVHIEVDTGSYLSLWGTPSAYRQRGKGLSAGNVDEQIAIMSNHGVYHQEDACTEVGIGAGSGAAQQSLQKHTQPCTTTQPPPSTTKHP